MTATHEPVGDLLGALCLRLYGVRPPDDGRLLAHVEARARQLGEPLSVYVARLHTDPLEQASLTGIATNGWTWLWREAATLIAACERLVARAPRRRTHAWVAGCSTGEEAFTLGIVAAQVGLELSILGTDVDAARIEHARRGRYADAALRHLPVGVAERWFAREGTAWTPRPELRARVRFEVHNLLDAPPPAPSGSWNLVSCRNVMLHADAPAAQRILAHLAHVTHPAGERVFSAVDELTVEEARLARDAVRTSPPPPLEAPSVPRVEATSGDFEARLTLGNLLLAGHRLEEAARAYESAAALEPTCAELLVMQGILHRKAGRVRAAEEALRQALFLEPDRWLGWLLLAGVYDRLGVEDRAQRALRAGLSALERRPRPEWRAPDCGVEERRMDPATAGRLCRERLRDGVGGTWEER